MSEDGAIEREFCCEQGRLLREKREHRRISQAQLGALVGVHRNTIWRWEDGDAGIPVWMLLRVADALSCNHLALMPAKRYTWGLDYVPIVHEARGSRREVESECWPLSSRRRLDEELAQMRAEMRAAGAA